MTNRLCLFLFSASLLLASCAPGEQAKDIPQMTFSASREDGALSKTSLEGASVLWSSEDKISVFSSSAAAGETYTILEGGAGKAEAKFSGNSVGTAPWYALYPADDAASLSDGVLTVGLPGIQKYSPNGFADGVNPMVAVSSNDKFTFKNLCGILSLQISGEGVSVASITLTSTAGEALWGKGSVDMNWKDAPALVMEKNESCSSLVLDCGEGVALGASPAVFNFVVPVGTLAGGISVKVCDTAGNEMIKSSGNQGLVSERAVVKRLAPIQFVPTGSAFLSETVFGVYDLGSGTPVAVKSYVKGDDQYALHALSAQKYSFRFQNPDQAFALFVEYHAGLEVGSECQLTISSIGETGVDDCTVKATLVKREGTTDWFQDFENQRGYIVFETTVQ